MTIAHATATRNVIADAVVDQLDGGDLVFYLANGTTEVATCPLNATAFDAAAAGVATANAITPDSAATGNASPIAKFALETSGAATVITGDVAVSDSDINLTNLTVANGDSVSMSALTYTACP